MGIKTVILVYWKASAPDGKHIIIYTYFPFIVKLAYFA